MERGIEATTIEDIRRSSQASIGSIYHHFGSKEQLANTLFMSGISSYQEEMLLAIEDAPTAEAGIRAVVHRAFQWTAANRDLAYFMEYRRPPAERAIMAERQDLNHQFSATVLRWLHTQVQAGAVRALSHDVYFALWIGPALQYLRLWLGNKGTDGVLQDTADVLASAAWSALKQ